MFPIDNDVYDPYLQKRIAPIDRCVPEIVPQIAKTILKWHFIGRFLMFTVDFLILLEK